MFTLNPEEVNVKIKPDRVPPLETKTKVLGFISYKSLFVRPLIMEALFLLHHYGDGQKGEPFLLF